MEIIVDHKLRIPLTAGPKVIDLIKQALTLTNLERIKAMQRADTRYWYMPEHIDLWNYSNYSNHLVVPRGFRKVLEGGLLELQVDYEFIDNMVFEGDPLAIDTKDGWIKLHEWQKPAVDSILAFRDGIWKAPAGSGKTVAILECIRLLKCPSIVLVNSKDILYQWVARAEQFLREDFHIGVIGDGKFQISDHLTIAMVQTLSSKYEELVRQEFFEQFSFMALDECHHVTADTYYKVINRFSSRYRIGVSATPEKTGDYRLAESVLGPIIHETKRSDVSSIINPIIYRIPTEFRYSYVSGSSYSSLIHELINDTKRNSLIIQSIRMNPDDHCLVLSQRIDHLIKLADGLVSSGYPNNVFIMTGSDTTKARANIIEHATKRPSVIFTTLGDEALDIPRLDSLFLVYPQRNTGLIQQQIGRVGRKHPDKKYAKVFDYCDPIGPLQSQWQARRTEVYLKHGYEIVTVLPKEIFSYDG